MSFQLNPSNIEEKKTFAAATAIATLSQSVRKVSMAGGSWVEGDRCLKTVVDCIPSLDEDMLHQNYLQPIKKSTKILGRE
ncbi:Uncharacterized protein APZ42_024376 [Daphnia magna]|uniref:Uncharacterized protein n=1 Tax=Daphnia magna TaxID=35525 RepID=A0A164U2Y7_9CRUS|nr:Uncharacterized protein APZ42_024376 [Daphnia magna]